MVVIDTNQWVSYEKGMTVQGNPTPLFNVAPLDGTGHEHTSYYA